MISNNKIKVGQSYTYFGALIEVVARECDGFHLFMVIKYAEGTPFRVYRKFFCEHAEPVV